MFCVSYIYSGGRDDDDSGNTELYKYGFRWWGQVVASEVVQIRWWHQRHKVIGGDPG